MDCCFVHAHLFWTFTHQQLQNQTVGAQSCQMCGGQSMQTLSRASGLARGIRGQGTYDLLKSHKIISANTPFAGSHLRDTTCMGRFLACSHCAQAPVHSLSGCTEHVPMRLVQGAASLWRCMHESVQASFVSLQASCWSGASCPGWSSELLMSWIPGERH